MCNFFADGDIEIEEPPRRHPNSPKRTRLRFVRPANRSSPRTSGELEVYRRPRSSETVVVHNPEPQEEIRHEEPITIHEPVIVPPTVPALPQFQPTPHHVHHHSRSTSSGYSTPHGSHRTGSHHRHSWTPSSHGSNEPFVRIVEASPEPRVPRRRRPQHGTQLVTTSRRNRHETHVVDNESDRDSFEDRRRGHRHRDHDDDVDSWTDEPRRVSRRMSGTHRSNSFTRRR